MFNYTGDGPLWKVIAGGDSQDCKDNWWTNLLYISNYVNADHMVRKKLNIKNLHFRNMHICGWFVLFDLND